MRSIARLIAAMAAVLFIPFPLLAGLDDSWDWPNDPATNKPRRKIRVKYGFPAGTKLGDKLLKDVMDEAVANWNGVKAKTDWEFEVVGDTDEADVTIESDDNLDTSGGAVTEFRTDKNGRVTPGSAKVKFDPSPPGYDWDKAGKHKDDTKNPVSCAKHELSHLLRLDHQGGKRSVSLKLKDPQGSDTKDDDVTTVSQDDIDEAKKTSALAIKQAVANDPASHGCELRVPAFAGETPAYPVPPDIYLALPSQAILSPAQIRLQRRSFNSLPDPFLRATNALGRVIKGFEVVVEGSPSLPPRAAVENWLNANIFVPYDSGELGYDHLLDCGDPDYGAAEERSMFLVIWDPRAGMWLPFEPWAVGGAFWIDPTNNFVQMVIPARLLNAFVMPGDPSTSRLMIALAARPVPFGDMLMIAPDPIRGGGFGGTAIVHREMPAPPGGWWFTLACDSPYVSLPPDPVLMPEGEHRVNVPFEVLVPPVAVKPLMEANGLGYHVDSFFDIFTQSVLDMTPTPSTAQIGQQIMVRAILSRHHDWLPLPGRPVLFHLTGRPAQPAFTDFAGMAQVPFVVPEENGPGVRALGSTWFGDWPEYNGAFGFAGLQVGPAPTQTWALDRIGTVTETIALRGYLRRTTDNAWLDGRTIGFTVDGTPVGSAVTGATGTQGRADLNWVIIPGPATRPIGVAFGGDASHLPSTGGGTLTAQTWTTKMVPFARTARITDRTELKARLLRSDNAPIYGKAIHFSVDGTFVITRNTNTDGYASYPFYDILDGAGSGVRTILSEWPGNGGYAAISRTADLTVLKAIPYIWVLSKSVPAGGIANLYAYFRRLYDYQKQANKPVTFRVDGTWIADVMTGIGPEAGVARHLHPTAGLGLGVHTVRCEFAGDAWVDAGYGEGNLTIL